DPEHQAEQVNAALETLPHETALLTALGQVGRTLLLSDVATEPQWRHVREQPGAQRAALSLLETLRHDNHPAAARARVRPLASGAVSRNGQAGPVSVPSELRGVSLAQQS